MMILILFGIVFLIKETRKLEQPVTMVTERAMMQAGCNFAVTAKAEQIPSTNTVIGLAVNRGFIKIFLSIAVTINFLQILLHLSLREHSPAQLFLEVLPFLPIT